jgi:putative ABC transport system permease protein
VDSFLHDLKNGVRMLLKNSGFTIVAVLTLALGIGANTAVFSLVNSVILRPLPLPDSRQLMVLFVKDGDGAPGWGAAYPDFEDVRQQNRSFQGITAYAPQSVNLTGREEPTRIRGGFVSANFFNIINVQPSLGRAFQPGDDTPGAARVTVVTYGFWKNYLGGDAGVLGKPVTLNGEVFTIVGVLPQGFEFPISASDVWIPVLYNPHFSRNRAVGSVAMIARLKESVSKRQAQAEVDTIAQRLAAQYPNTDRNRTMRVTSLQEAATSDIRPALLILMAAVGFVLLIACANVASLLLVRASARHREMALRATLGAGGSRLIRQMLTETLLLWFSGTFLGLFVSHWAVAGLARLRPADSWAQFPAKLDAPVLLATLGITILTGLLFGLVPAIRLASPDLIGSLKAESRGSGRDAGSSRTGRWLVISEVALCLVLLLGAGLTMKSLAKLTGVDPGFNPKNLLTLEYRLPRSKYPEKSQQWNFHRAVVEHAAALRGVVSAAEVMGLPISGNGGDTRVVFTDRPAPAPTDMPRSQINYCDSHYFHTMEVPLLRGRDFNREDTPDSARVAIVNQSMVDRFWNGKDPVGKSFRLPDEDNVTVTIVGVVGDVKQFDLDDLTAAQIYLPQAQHPDVFTTLIVRTQGDPMALSSALRSAVWAVDKDQPVWKIRTEESLLDLSVGPRRFLMLLLEVFSALSLMLATIGIYGVTSYSTGQRLQEIGVRIALGAQKQDILRLVLQEGLWIAALGVGIGALAALGLSRFLASQLYGVSAGDPPTFATAAALLTLVTLLACYIPARRATNVDPISALRHD